jgi:hypothetical protein
VFTKIWLTDEDSDIQGYKRAKLDSRSESSSLVRKTQAVGASQVIGSWITNPLDGPVITQQQWEAHFWAYQTNVASNANLALSVIRFTNQEAGSALLTDSVLLPATRRDIARTTTNFSLNTPFNVGDRLVLRLSQSGTAGTGYNVELDYNGFFPNTEGDSYIICLDTLELASTLPEQIVLDIRQMLKDMSNTNPNMADIEIAMHYDLALKTYSQARPLTVSQFYSGDGNTYQFPLPRLWVKGLSDVISMEYPTGINPRSMLEKSDDWGIFDSWLGVQPTTKVWISQIPQAGTDNVMMTYTTGHMHNLDICTVPYLDRLAIEWLATAYCARAMSARGASYIDSTVDADSVNYRDMEIRWKDVAAQYYQMWHDFIFGSKDGDNAASGRDDWDVMTSYKFDYLFHRRRYR